MKDPITTAFVVKGAVTHPEYSEFLHAMSEGEVETVDYLVKAADILESEYATFNPDDFDHLVFAYEIADPFGAKIVEQTIAGEGELGMHVIAGLAVVLLNEHRRELTRHNVKITRNGMTVDCYGEWQEDSNCLIVGDWASGVEMEEVWAGDGWPHEGMPANWTQVVEHLTAWAKRNGHTIYELSAC